MRDIPKLVCNAYTFASLFIAITAVNLNHTAVDKGIVDAEAYSISNLVHCGESVYGRLAANAVSYSLRLVCLPNPGAMVLTVVPVPSKNLTRLSESAWTALFVTP